VTGGAGGIGAAVVEALAADGVAVACCDHVPPEGDARGAVGNYGAVENYRLDVTDPRAVRRTVAAVEADLGPIHYLANVAGVLTTARVLDPDPGWDEHWQRLFAVNTVGVVNVSRAVAARMASRGHGAIVTVGSNAAAVPRVGMAAYCASKAAAHMFTRVLGLELAEYGVRANIVSPGSTRTPMLAALLGADDADDVVAGDPAAFKLGIPLGRVATPAAVAAAVRFLLSDAAAHITLHDLRVDGGATPGT